MCRDHERALRPGLRGLVAVIHDGQMPVKKVKWTPP